MTNPVKYIEPVLHLFCFAAVFTGVDDASVLFQLGFLSLQAAVLLNRKGSKQALSKYASAPCVYLTMSMRNAFKSDTIQKLTNGSSQTLILPQANMLDMAPAFALKWFIQSFVTTLPKSCIDDVVDKLLFDKHGDTVLVRTERMQLLTNMMSAYKDNLLRDRAVDRVLHVFFDYMDRNSSDVSVMLNDMASTLKALPIDRMPTTIIDAKMWIHGVNDHTFVLPKGITETLDLMMHEAFRNRVMAAVAETWVKHKEVERAFHSNMDTWLPEGNVLAKEQLTNILFKDPEQAQDVLLAMLDEEVLSTEAFVQIKALHNNRMTVDTLPRLMLQKMPAQDSEIYGDLTEFNGLFATHGAHMQSVVLAASQMTQIPVVSQLLEEVSDLAPQNIPGEIKVSNAMLSEFAVPVFDAVKKHTLTLEDDQVVPFFNQLASIASFTVAEPTYNTDPACIKTFYDDLAAFVASNAGFIRQYADIFKACRWEALLRCVLFKDRYYDQLHAFIPYFAQMAEVWLSKLIDENLDLNVRTEALKKTAYCLTSIHTNDADKFGVLWDTMRTEVINGRSPTGSVLPAACNISRPGVELLAGAIQDKVLASEVIIDVDFIQLVLNALLPQEYDNRVQSMHYVGRLLDIREKNSAAQSMDYRVINTMECMVKIILNVAKSKLNDHYSLPTALPAISRLIMSDNAEFFKKRTIKSAELDSVLATVLDVDFLRRCHTFLSDLRNCYQEPGPDGCVAVQDKITFCEVLTDFFSEGEYEGIQIQGIRDILMKDNDKLCGVLAKLVSVPSPSVNVETGFLQSCLHLLVVSKPFDELLANICDLVGSFYILNEMQVADNEGSKQQLLELFILQVSKLWLLNTQDTANQEALDALNKLRKHPHTSELVAKALESEMFIKCLDVKDASICSSLVKWLTNVSGQMLSMDDANFTLFCNDLAVLQGSEGSHYQKVYDVMSKPYFNDVSDSIVGILGDSYPSAKSMVTGEFFGSIGLNNLNNPPKDFLQFCCNVMSYFYHHADMGELRNSVCGGDYLLSANRLIDGVLRPKKPKKVASASTQLWKSFAVVKNQQEHLSSVLTALVPMPKNVAKFACSQLTYYKSMSCWLLASSQVLLSVLSMPLALLYQSYRKDFATNMYRMVSSFKYMLLNIYQLPVALLFAVRISLHMVFGLTYECAKFLYRLPWRIMNMDIKQAIVSNLGLYHCLALAALSLVAVSVAYTTTPIHFVALSASFLWFLPVGVGMFTKSSIKGVFKREIPSQSLKVKPVPNSKLYGHSFDVSSRRNARRLGRNH